MLPRCAIGMGTLLPLAAARPRYCNHLLSPSPELLSVLRSSLTQRYTPYLVAACILLLIDEGAQGSSSLASTGKSPVPEFPARLVESAVATGSWFILPAHFCFPQPLQGLVLRPLPGNLLHTVCLLGNLTYERWSQQHVGAVIC